ncbi:hypothetical protein RRG08_043530 [Elysia crispata]|uniref:Uncharacterized protein n=1 Tax=Elysia crispata TaxID=231223 RepID=A0AAE0YFC1_9GAST|nr:hypothetical protein RRG08_043530 [Elysia crispata]
MVFRQATMAAGSRPCAPVEREENSREHDSISSIILSQSPSTIPSDARELPELFSKGSPPSPGTCMDKPWERGLT